MLKAPICYQGSKRKELKYIDKALPKNFGEDYIFVDVYGGGGSVSLYMFQKYNCTVVYNDIDPLIVRFFRILQSPVKTKKLMLEMKKLKINQSSFNKIKKIYPTLNLGYKKIAYYYYLIYSSFLGTKNTFMSGNTKPTNDNWINKINNLSKYNKIVDNINIINRDGLELINSHNKKYNKILFYCDPPYINTDQSTYLYKFDDKKTVELFNLLINSEHKLLIHVNITKISDAYKKYKKVEYTTNYNLNNYKNAKKNTNKKTVIFGNY